MLKTEQVYANKLRGKQIARRGKLTTGQTKHHSLFTEKRQATQIRPRTNLRKVIVLQHKQPANKCEQAKTHSHVQVGPYHLLEYQMVWREGF